MLLGLLALLLWGGTNYYSKNCNCNAPTLTSLDIPSLNLVDGSAFNGCSTSNLMFATSGFEARKPIDPEVEKSFKSTAHYLKTQANRSLKITGFYGDAETNSSIYANLGLGRANYIKSMLTSFGAPAAQIFTDGVPTNDLTFIKGNVLGGATYTFFETPNTEDTRTLAIEKDLKIHPLVLYFENGKSTLTLNDDQHKRFTDLQYYLGHKTGAKITVIGYSNNQGSADKNLAISKERAQFVVDNLKNKGIDVSKIQIIGKGQTEPIAPNTDEDGRAKNRRVVIVVSE